MAKLSRDSLRLIALLKRDFIVGGGGITVRQLTTGQYQISMSDADLESNSRRANPYTNNPSFSGGTDPGEPVNPGPPIPPKRPLPPLPPEEEIGSGDSYDGSPNGRRSSSNGDPSKPAENDPPYDFAQRGWEYYVDNF